MRKVRETENGGAPVEKETTKDEDHSIYVNSCNLHLHFDTIFHCPVANLDLLQAAE
jgi:hypothetical protein